MKRCMLLLTGIFFFAVSAFADNDTPITIDRLPANAKQLVEKYFAGQKVSYAKMESELFDKSYEVVFMDGSKVEFDKNGNWKDVNCKFSQVPDGIIPQPIKTYVDTHYKDVKIIGIELDNRRHEVKLGNGLELTFDSKFNVVELDN